MSGVIDFLEDVANFVIEAIEDLVVAAWDSIVEPILEQVFAIFGITDETIVTVQRVTSPIYQTKVGNVYQAGITRAILKKVKTDTTFFPNYMQEIYLTKGQVRAYFRYAELDLYINGLPTLNVKGVAADFSAIQIALDDTFGSTHTVLSAISRNPNPTQWFSWEMQDSPDFYKPWLNTLTHTGVWGVEYDDWFWDSVVYNSGPDNYSINISRTAEEAQFWIQGPNQITEGDTATFTVKSNRLIPVGETMTINFTYAGTAVDGVDYTEVASVDMLAGTDEITVDIVTAETANANRTFAITIGSLDNAGGIFETVTIHAQDTVNCVITDDDALMLTMPDILVDEANVTIMIPVKLEQAAPSGAFSIDYNFTDLGSITGGVDYDNTTGTLNFAGTLGEVQNISVDIYADIADDDKEQFEVFLENSTDVDSIITTAISTVTIIDGTSDPVAGDAVVNDVITKASYVPVPSIVVTYSDDSGPPGEFWYWIQPHSDPTYDLLPVAQTLDGLEMLPLAILRKNKTNIDVDPGVGTPTYITTRMLMQRVAFNIDDFLEAIAANPDASDIDDAYLNYAMQPLDVNKTISKMLYLAWFEIVVTNGLTSNVGEFSATIEEGDIQNAIVWNQNIYTDDVAGVVTTEGEYIHTISGTDLIMQYQRTATHYDEVRLNKLNGMTAINYQTYHEVALSQLGDNEFTIPVSWDTFNKLTAIEQMEVYQYLVRLDMNAINITHLDWYETEAFWELFDFALIIISVVIIVWSVGTATNLTAAAYAFIQSYVVAYAIGELIIFVAEATGSDILGALAGVALAIYLNNPDGLTTDQLMQADELLNMSTDFVDNLALIKTEEAEELSEDLAQLNKEAQEKIDEALEKRDDVEDVTIDSEFLVSLQGVDTNYLPAIQGQYDYDTLYNYDSLVSDFFDTRLQKGVRQ